MSFILGVAVFGQRIRTMFAICWFILLYSWVNVVVVSSGVDWGVIFSCAVIVVFAEAGFGAAPTPSLWFLLDGAILRCILPFLVIVLFGCIHHIYISCDEVAIQRPVGSGSCSSLASSSIPSMSSESKSSMSVKSSTVAIK